MGRTCNHHTKEPSDQLTVSTTGKTMPLCGSNWGEPKIAESINARKNLQLIRSHWWSESAQERGAENPQFILNMMQFGNS